MTEAVETQVDPMTTPFIRELVKVWRAQDAHGAWESKSDEQLLSPYILDKEQRKQIPIIGDPDPDTLWRLELYYNAVGLAVEKQTGHILTPMMKMSHEGFGRVMLSAGRLIVVNKYLRDVHRFSFLSLEKLSEEGGKLVDTAVTMIKQFPEVVNYSA